MATSSGIHSENVPLDHVSGTVQATASPAGWRRHPVDLRLTLPGFGGKYYITFVAGRERRAPDRRAEEREKYPVLTLGNVFFSFGLLTIVTVFALAAFIAQSAIIEY